jgi:phosphoribosylformylglycinamidine cyclo-ligase
MPNFEKDQSYASAGVDYDTLDAFKRLCQARAAETSGNALRRGVRSVKESRGESAYVLDEGDRYSAHVEEGLGTKNLVADSVRLQTLRERLSLAPDVEQITKNTYYDAIGKDTVATMVNDLIVVGGDPLVVTMHAAVGNSAWFNDPQRNEDLTRGFRDACHQSGAEWGAGETPSLSGIIFPNAIVLSGSAYGWISPKDNITIPDVEGGRPGKLSHGDAIVLVESSGIHANGLSLARKVAQNIAIERSLTLSEAYATELPDGNLFGEALLTPAHIYAPLTQELFKAGIDIHYMAHITGHGWRKLMRANEEFSYVIDNIPEPHPVFQFMQEQLQYDDQQMYETFNMGAGLAIYLSQDEVERTIEIAQEKGLAAIEAGYLSDGPKQIKIRTNDVYFPGDTLSVR